MEALELLITMNHPAAWHESWGLRGQWCNSSGEGQAQVQGFREEGECQWAGPR